MNGNRILRLMSGVILGISLALVLGACGGDNGDNENGNRRNGPAGASPQAAALTSTPTSTAVIQQAPEEGVAEDAALRAAGGEPGTANAAVDLVSASAGDTAYRQHSAERLIIKNGQLSLLVEDTGDALGQVNAIAAHYGGYVIGSEASNTSIPRTATITIAVEASQFEAAMNALREIGKEVLNDSASGQDVTDEYVDLESRLESLEATRDRIMTFLEQARNVDEALAVNGQLAIIEAEIEQVKGRMTYLSGRAAYSTITVSLQEPAPTPTPSPTPTLTPIPSPTPPPKRWSPYDAFDSAVDAQESLVHFLVDGGIWLVVFLGPYLSVGGLVLFGAYWWTRRRKTVSPAIPPASPLPPANK